MIPYFSVLTGVGSADELIDLVDPRRDTGVGTEILICSAWGILRRLINSFYIYLCSHPMLLLLAYFCCLILFSIYTIGFCFAMEFVDDVDLLTPTKPLFKSLHRTQKGRWRHHPQGVSRPIKSRTVLNKHKARIANFWSKYCKPTKWFEVDKWYSEFDWKPLLDCDYSDVFDQSCKKYSH